MTTQAKSESERRVGIFRAIFLAHFNNKKGQPLIESDDVKKSLGTGSEASFRHSAQFRKDLTAQSVFALVLEGTNSLEKSFSDMEDVTSTLEYCFVLMRLLAGGIFSFAIK